jgi:hypothetical protein
MLDMRRFGRLQSGNKTIKERLAMMKRKDNPHLPYRLIMS